MNTDETQIKPEKDYSLSPITEQLIGAACELKTDSEYRKIYEAQLINELRGTGIKLGFLINFGRERVEYSRRVF